MRSTEEACRWGRQQIDNPSEDWTEACLKFSRMCPGALGGTDFAYQAWDFCPPAKRRAFDGRWEQVRRGAIFVWANGRAGHAVWCLGGGLCLSNDFKRRGKINVVPLSKLGPWCSGTPRGQVGWVNGVHFLDFKGDDVSQQPPRVSISDVRRAALRDPQAAEGTETAGAVADVLKVERALHARGYLSEDYVDGHFGTKTRAAMLHFERDIKAPQADGIPGGFSLPRLGKSRFKVVA